MVSFALVPVKYWCFLMEIFQKRGDLGEGLFRRYCSTLQRRSQPQIRLKATGITPEFRQIL